MRVSLWKVDVNQETLEAEAVMLKLYRAFDIRSFLIIMQGKSGIMCFGVE